MFVIEEIFLGKSYKPLSISVFKAQGVDFELYEVSSQQSLSPRRKEYDPETDDIHTDEPIQRIKTCDY